jgi:hypothetical protein
VYGGRDFERGESRIKMHEMLPEKIEMLPETVEMLL